jgi:hypothetical protein
MMTFDQIADATLEQLTDELAAAGWDSCETQIDLARMSVARLLVESMPVGQLMTQLDEAGLESFQDWKAGSTRWFVVPDELSITVTGEEVEILSLT